MSALKRKKFWGSAPKNKLCTSSNRFKDLENLEDNCDTYSEGEIETQEPKFVVPPIVVDAVHGFSAVYQLLGSTYQFKRMSIGTKVVSPTLSDFTAAKTTLTAAKFLFYTHDVKDKNLFKLVLFGLPLMDINSISEELRDSFNVTAKNIREIKTARSSADDALYMIEFDRSQHIKRDIIKIKYLRGIAIRWKNPQKGTKGPTFCTKCTMYGHGSKNCFRNSICIACGGGHDYSTCHVNKTDQEGPVVYKCFNCVKKNLKNCNHRADDPKCPNRREYIMMRQNLNVNKSHPKPISKTAELDFIVNNDSTKTGSKVSYSEVVKQRIEQNANGDNELFSVEELFNIFSGAITDLRKCSTKIEQLNVIMSLLKYAL